MEELSARETLFERWMIFTSKNDENSLAEFIQLFVETHRQFVDHNFEHLNEGFSEEGPHLTRLPDGILEVFGTQLSQCAEKYTSSHLPLLVKHAESIVKCLIVICRNYDNVPLVASCEFVSNTVTIATTVVEQLCAGDNCEAENSDSDDLTTFLHHVLHFFECLYDPYFIWRKRYRGWKVDKSRLKFKPALLHVEVIPFFHECFQKPSLSTGIQLRLLHLFGAIMSGTQYNALKAITPATLDVLLKIVGRNQLERPTNEQRHDMLTFKALVLRCIVRMVHVIHCCTPDQRQVEVGQVMEGYLHLLQTDSIEGAGEEENQQRLNMIGTINEMMACREKSALQVALVSGGTFDAFVSLLQKTPLTGSEAQSLAISVINVMTSVLAGSASAKELFGERVGYEKFVESLKSLGQPSMDLLRTVLGLVVESEYTEDAPLRVQNTEAAVMLLQWLPDIQSHQLQIWLSENLFHLCSNGSHNRMSCCAGGLIAAILGILYREKQINTVAVCHLINLLESLGKYSITAQELKQLIGLLRLDEEGKQNPYCSRLMRSLSIMARRDGKEGALRYVDIQEPSDGISLSEPIKKWSGAGFTFHAWVCLDTTVDLCPHAVTDPLLYRRQLYLVTTSGGSGLEAFFTPDYNLVVAVFNKKECSSVTVPDFTFGDQEWHNVHVIHSTSRRPFTHSQVSVYVDGKLVLNKQLKFPVVHETGVSVHIGTSGRQNMLDPEQFLPPMSPTAPEGKSQKSPLKSFFQTSAKSIVSNHPGVSNIPGGTQDEIWGPAIALIGQIGSVGIFSESLQEKQIESLHMLGPNQHHLFKQDGDLSDVPGKLLLHYNAKCFRDGVCYDLSPNGNHGSVVGTVWVTFDIKDVINSIGGIQLLYPLLEQLAKSPPCKPLTGEGGTNTDCVKPNLPVTGEVQDGWVVIPSSSYADANLEQNQVAGFLTMLRHMLQTHTVNQDTFIRTNGAATIGALLQQVSPALIDVNVMMAVQLLVISMAEINRTILQSLYQYVLFDFRIWSKSDFPVRIGHIQYLSTFIKDDRKAFRKKYGVQYILDVIRSYYSSKSDCDLSAEDAKTIRGSLLGLIKFYISKDITYDELSQMIGFVTVIKDENLIIEVLDLLIGLLEKKGRQDQLFLLLYEPDMSELLYSLLIVPQYTVELRERVLKMFGLLLRTDKVYEKNKSRLRLTEPGYTGLVRLMDKCDVSLNLIKLFIEMVTLTDWAQGYSAVLSILHLIPFQNLDIKLEASRQILTLLVSKSTAAKTVAKQFSWQECLASLFILLPNTVNRSSTTESSASVQNPVRRGCSSRSNSESDTNSNNGGATRPPSFGLGLDITDQPDLSNYEMSLAKTPSTPFYIRQKSFDFENISDYDLAEDRPRSMSRSSSASVEDLTNAFHRNSVSSQSLSSQALTENSEDSSVAGFCDNDEMLYRRPSVIQAENFQKALDNLGIQKIYVNDALEKSEELCQNLLIILLTVMWKGLEGSDKTVWKERGQVFASLSMLSECHELIRPVNQLKRRLIEMMLHSCTSDLRDTVQVNATCSENAVTLTRILYYFIVDESSDAASKFSDRLIEDVMTLLDALSVWDTASGAEWTEMVYLGFGILIEFSKQQNLELCAVATAKLHQLIRTRVFTSSAEASFLIGSLNHVVSQAMEESTDNYSFLMTVMKALLDRVFTLLNLEVHLPTLSEITGSPNFFEEFKTYSQKEEWKYFISTLLEPQLHHFQATHFDPTAAAMAEFWADCHEAMMVSRHKRNREAGESKLKFQSMVVEPFKARAIQEQRRFQNVTTQQRNQNQAVCRHWRATTRFYFSERGAWALREINKGLYWKLSNHENFSRMKVKLVPNYNFDLHEEASKLRDNLDIQENPDDKLLKLVVSKEAKVAMANLGDDVLGDEDWNVISSASAASEEYSGKEKFVFSEECELVTLMEVVKGRLEVTTTHVYFFDCSPNKEEGGEDFKWALSQLREIHFRRYNLRRSALEMFLIDQTNYFLNFQKKVRNKVYSRLLSLRPPNLTYYGSRSPAELLKSSGLTQKWVHREISNFDYLMQLNTIAGRTYNDLSQYPVFPWILSDYTSETLDLENPQSYRDLSKPVGVVNPRNEKEVREKYETFEDPTGMMEKFHYGTHYSNAAGVMHYMIRMEPFTTLHIQLQAGRFDVADRQFHSIPSSWHSLMENPNDVKELIPEFYYLPEFLVNHNEFDLGKLQLSKERVNDVVLPKWASSPADFIYKHRKALESEIVSANLHHWIDLIFGYKQKGPAAVEALNVFFYCTYEGAVDLDAVTDDKQRAALEGMINNFGQTPTQLLKEPHPRRMSFGEFVRYNAKVDRPLSVLHFLSDLKAFFAEVSSDLDPLVFVNVPRSQQRSIIQHGMPDTMVTVTRSGLLGVHGWLPYDKSISNYFTFQRDPSTIPNSKTKKGVSGPFAPGLMIEPKLFVVSHDAKLLFSGGHWDNSLQVFNISKGKKVCHIVRHTDVVTCLALDYCGRNLITGSRDTTCMVWQVSSQKVEGSGVVGKPIQTLYGHDAEIMCVHLSMELDLAVSASKDGNVLIHTIRKGHYMRTIRPPSHGTGLVQIPMLKVSNTGQMVIYCRETGIQGDSPSNTATKTRRERHSLHVYSINGQPLSEEILPQPLGDMVIMEDYVVIGNAQGQLAAKLMFGLETVTSLSLHIPIQCISLTNNNSHVLVGLKDGKLIIVCIKGKSDIR